MMFYAADHIFPIMSATQRSDGTLTDGRFIGSGFWVTDSGHFLTCSHVFSEVGEGMVAAIGKPFSEKRDTYIRIMRSECHAKFDIALGTAFVTKPTKPLDFYLDTTAPGLDVSAFGYTDAGKKGTTLNLDVRYLKGHLTRTAEESQGLPARRIVETSFGSPSGFSGAPLLVDFKVAGMLYGNIETRLQSYSILEVHDTGREFRETTSRIYEYGLSHNRDDLLTFIAACDLTPYVLP